MNITKPQFAPKTLDNKQSVVNTYLNSQRSNPQYANRFNFAPRLSILFYQPAISKAAMRLFSTLCCLMMWASLSAQKGTDITLKLKLDNCSVSDSALLYVFDGLQLKSIMVAQQAADKTFTFTVKGSDTPNFVYVGINVENEPRVRSVLVGTEKIVNFTGPCYDIRKGAPVGSKINTEYDYAVSRNNTLKVEMGNIVNDYRQFYADPIKRKEIEGRMGEVDKKKIALLDSLKKSNPYIADIIALDTYISYQNSPDAAKYQDEINYFVNEYFHYVDFSNTNYNRIPAVFDMFKSWADVISMVGIPEDQQMMVFDAILARVPAGSTAYQNAMGGIITSLIANKQNSFVTMGERYGSLYATTDPINVQRVMSKVVQVKANMTGIPAQDFTMNDRNDLPVALSSMKGKVVLVDFWASWCGPCRRENPNVVALYNQYHAKGFDVFSVSLDKTKEPWLAAIEKDGLVWNNHVCDMLGWQNAAAQLYGVTSIPYTMLLDREGKIIARQLRGEQLAAKLAELFPN